MSLKRGTPEYESRKQMLAERRTRQYERSQVVTPKLPAGKYVPAGRLMNVAGTVVRNSRVCEQMNRIHDKWLEALQKRITGPVVGKE